MQTEKQEARQVGRALDSYMRFRAAHEGVEYGFTPKFFEQAILKGCEGFFGITFADGKLIADEQQPDLFKQWSHLN